MIRLRWLIGLPGRWFPARGPAYRTVAAVLLLEVVGLAAWWIHGRWQLGRVELDTEDPPLKVQVLGESGDDPIDAPVDLIGTASLALPAGDYRLRVTGSGRLSQTYRVAVNRGETVARTLTLDDNRLLGEESAIRNWTLREEKSRPIPYAPTVTALELTPGTADLVEWSDRNIIRRDGVSGEVVWDALRAPRAGEPRRAYHPWLLWNARWGRWGALGQPTTVDIDGDGTLDLVFTIRNQPALVALSGKDGSVLWTYRAQLDGSGGDSPEGPELPGPIRPALRPGEILHTARTTDLDRDGIPDLVATVGFHEFPAEIARRLPRLTPLQLQDTEGMARRAVVALSGRSGKMIWSHAIDPAFRSITTQSWDQPAQPVPGRTTSTIAIVDGPTWRGLDPATGRPRSGPIDLGFEPARPLQYADLDGDGDPEILALGPGTTMRTLSAFSIATGHPLWTATINTGYGNPGGNASRATWPLVVDLDGDGRSEIVVPDSGSLDPRNGYHGVQVLDGPTGGTRWTRPMRLDEKVQDGLFDLFGAPDLDGDGVRDIVASSKFTSRQAMTGPSRSWQPDWAYVDALSGKDGRPIWWWRAELAADRYPYLAPPRWWGRGPDGWPLLAASIGEHDPNVGGGDTTSPTVHMVEASTGRELETLTGLNRTHVDDLDGDGLADLWGDFDGDLRAFRGEGPEAWRALGYLEPVPDPILWYRDGVQPAADLDGDGISDTLTARLAAPGNPPRRELGSRTAVARSGRDGRLLWTAGLDVRKGWFDRDRGEHYDLKIFPAPAGDLDGDGTADVLVVEDANQPPARALRRPPTIPLQMLSGRTGRSLWIAGPLPLDFEAHGYSMVRWAGPVVVEPGARPDILVRHESPFLAASPTPPTPNGPAQDRLARISGRTGRVLWDVPLSVPVQNSGFNGNPPPWFHDLDGDGLAELVAVASIVSGSGQDEAEIKAVSARDGRVLWSQPLATMVNDLSNIRSIEWEGGKRRALVVFHHLYANNKGTVIVRAFDGRDGKPLWTWDGGEEYGGSRSDPLMLTARLDENTESRICVYFRESGGMQRTVVLDEQGREVIRRDSPGIKSPGRDRLGLMRVADLDGDGREEFVAWHSERLRAIGRDGKELWTRPDETGEVSLIVPASSGRTATLIVSSGLALDGMTGVPRWASPQSYAWWARSNDILDFGDGDRMPLIVSYSQGATLCRAAMPTTSAGTYAPPHGTPAPPGLARDDPRWTRPLPWTEPMLRTIGPEYALAAIGLALVCAVLPLGLLILAARRRPWTLRLLMALPIAAALPLWVFQTIEPLIPAEIGTTPVSPRTLFVLATLAGLPIVLYAGSLVANLYRGRWKSLAGMAVLTIAAAAIVAAAWIRVDSRGMPAIEHYGRTGWPLALVLGAYAVGVLLPIGWMLRRPYQWLRRARRPEVGTP